MFHKDMDEYYYIIRGWCVYCCRTYSLGVGFFNVFYMSRSTVMEYILKVCII